jgi:hypothetical protein
MRTDFTLSMQSGQVLPFYLNLFPSKKAMLQYTNTDRHNIPFKAQAPHPGHML